MDSFIGQIRLFAGSYLPKGWAYCDGAILPIGANLPLFSLIGTKYGGDGATTFALPNLQMRLLVGSSDNRPPNMVDTYSVGATGGSMLVSLAVDHLPAHTHSVSVARDVATDSTPGETLMPAIPADPFTMYARKDPEIEIDRMQELYEKTIGVYGEYKVEGHSNVMPTIVLNYIICMSGLYPDLSQ